MGPLTYLEIKKFKGPKMDSLSDLQVILHGNSFGKSYVHWTRFSKKINNLFYMEILLQKATFTGHELQKKINSYFTWKFFFKKLRSLDTNCAIIFSRVVPRTSLSTINFGRVVHSVPPLSTINFCRVVHSVPPLSTINFRRVVPRTSLSTSTKRRGR